MAGPASSTASRESSAGGAPPWRALHYLNLYRVALSMLFIVVSLLELSPGPVGLFDPGLFQLTAMLYFAFGIASGFTIHRCWPAFDVQLIGQVTVDIVAVTLMMHTSGGVISGFGMLLVVAVAAGSLVAPGRVAILFAALAALAVLGQQLYSTTQALLPGPNYPHAGMLGIACFAAAALAFFSARRIRASEALAAKREVDLANLAQLSEHIVQRMQSGILAVDADERIRLVNESAQRLLGVRRPLAGRRIGAVIPGVAELLQRWRVDRGRSTYLYRSEDVHLEVMVSFAGLGQDASDGVLMFLEDSSAMTQRAQQLKLASLGRLTASIAHEIRNPLAAISHAGQLLAESSALTEGDRRLTRIIRDNSQRMNHVVENVLQVSRRKPPAPESFELEPWLEAFVEEYARSTATDRARIRTSVEPDGLRVRVDPSQLHQVLWNLCENGLRHANGAEPALELRAGVHRESARPYLEVVDNGAGIPAETAEQIFEPFFTTETNGTGLGLYIARELCESNQASLAHIPTGSGCCFRITFSDPRRRGVAAA